MSHGQNKLRKTDLTDMATGQEVTSHMATMQGAAAQNKKRILLMGLKRSGKTSILNVILYKIPPSETVFIPTTVVIKKHEFKSFRTFHIWDLPGQINYLGSNFDSRAIFEDAGVMAWVIDAQDDYTDSVNRLGKTVLALQENYPEIKIAVFIHKTDSLSSDFRDEVVRDITQRITDELNDAGLENPPIAFYPTSVYDTSIFEAMSKVMQLMVPQYDNFEALLSNIATNCKFQKLYLFDNMTKLYFASDTSPADTRSYNLCQDFFDSIVDLAEMFNYNRKAVTQQASQQGGSSEQNGESSQQGAAVQAPVPMKNQAHSFVGGSRGCFLYLQEINPHFSIIGWSREPNFAQEKSQVDYNVTLFSEAFKKVLAHTNA